MLSNEAHFSTEEPQPRTEPGGPGRDSVGRTERYERDSISPESQPRGVTIALYKLYGDISKRRRSRKIVGPRADGQAGRRWTRAGYGADGTGASGGKSRWSATRPSLDATVTIAGGYRRRHGRGEAVPTTGNSLVRSSKLQGLARTVDIRFVFVSL